jgi:multidrug resistance efflux pump
MDIARPDLAKKRKRKRIIWGAVLVVAIAAATLGLSQLKPALPSVDRATVWIEPVQRGNMTISVRGLGTLVPQSVQAIPAITEGRVVERPILPGTPVKSDTILLVLSNPQLVQQTKNAELALKAAEAQYNNLEATLESQYLQLAAAATTADANYRSAKIDSDADKKMYDQGVGSLITYQKAAVLESGLRKTSEMAQAQLQQQKQLMKAQLAAQDAQVAQARALAELDEQEVADLTVRAGMNGVLQDLGPGAGVSLGQEVQPGTTLADVVDPTKLWAELDIPETEAKDLLLGQSASVDTHNGIVPGKVIRINPTPVNGTVAVDVTLDGPLPKGARPNLSVEGTILIEKLTDVLYVGRPVHAERDSRIGLFKLTDDGKEAVRVPVWIGKVSVNTVEIVKGLQVGDRVILSDMSAQENYDRIRLD